MKRRPDNVQKAREKDQGARGKAQDSARSLQPAGRFTFHGLRFLLPSCFFLAFLALYTFTLSPGLLPADAGEYQLAGATLGVAHPPGYALYTLLSWLTTRWLWPLSPAKAINFLSALLAALTLVLLERVVHRLTRSHLAGYGAALALGFSTTFWAQAVTANVRMLAVLAVALALDRLGYYRRTLKARALGEVALALGLGISHHASLVFIAAVLGLYALWLKPSALRRPWPLLLGLLPFVAWVYFPLRAELQPSLATFNGFLEHVLARGFQGDILYFATLKDLPDRLFVFRNMLTFEFNGPLLILTALGVLVAIWRDRQFGLVLASAFAIHTFIAITYRAPQTVEYFLPACVFMAAFLGFAFAELLGWLSRLFLALSAFIAAQTHAGRRPRLAPWLGSALALLVFAFPLAWQFRAAYSSYRALAADDSARAYAESVLTGAPQGARLLASWNWATPLWYLQRVEHQRPDVEISYVYPQGASLAQNWADEIKASLPARPVVVTSFYAQEYAALPYRFAPLGPAWLVLPNPPTAPPANLAGAQTIGHWTFLGYRLESAAAPPLAASGATFIDVTTAWRTSGAPQDVALFVHLRNAEGELYGQMDISHLAGRYVSGEVLIDRYRLFIRPGAPAGQYSLVAGAYLPDGTRLAEVPLTTLPVALPQPLISPPPAPAVPLGDSIFFLSADVHPAGPVHPGEAVTVDVHFLASRPILSDYTVKVDLIGPNWSWRVQSDSTPVGGAIPTLKWIAGSRLADRRTLVVPTNAAPGLAQLVLAVYDSFTQFGLPILDPQLAAQGPTLPLATVEIIGPR